MKRGRKIGKDLPVQKTTLLNFFSKTSSTVSQTSSAPDGSKSVTLTHTSTSKARIQLAVVKCPACAADIKETEINVHLDKQCSSSPTKAKILNSAAEDNEVVILSVESSNVLTLQGREAVPEAQEDLMLSTPPRATLPPRRAASTSKKNELGRMELTAENLTRLTQTTPRKGSRFSSFRHLNKTSSPGKTAVIKSLFRSEENLSSPTKEKPKYEVPYYLDHFRLLIGASLDEKVNEDLFNKEDLEFVDKFRGLTLPAQKLYVRLFSRKLDWHRANRLEYDEIAADLGPLLEEIRAATLLDCGEGLRDLENILQLLSLPEIKLMCKELKLPQNNKNLSVKALLDFCRTQRSILGPSSVSKKIAEKALRLIGPCYKVAIEPRRTFLRMLLLTQLHRCLDDDEDRGKQQVLVTHLMVSVGRMTYPQYQIIRTRKIFANRQSLIEFEEAIQLEFQQREALENQNWTKMTELGDTAAIHLEKCLRDTTWDKSLPPFLRRFTSGSLYTYCLWKRIEAYQRLRRYKEAVAQLENLIQQDAYLVFYRGKWYERLALNLDQHLKQYEKALEVLKAGLNDPYVSPSHKLALSLRARKICESTRARHLNSLLNDLPLLTAEDPPSVTITGRSLPRDMPGYKAMFITGDSQMTPADGDVTLCSVEELVLGYYKEQGYTEGMHAEGSTMTTLLGLCFWDVLYHCDVPDTFVSPHQPVPLDLGSEDFYAARKALIDDRLEAIRSWNADQLMAFLTDIWGKHHGTISLVAWNRFRSLEHAQSLVRSLPRHSLAAVFHRMITNYAHYRAGFPDLVVWNPIKMECRIVEVKGPNDRLSNKQILWLSYLNSVGLQSEVCHVKAVGAKRMSSVNGPLDPRTPEKSDKSVTPAEDQKTVNPAKRHRRTRKARTSKATHGSDDDFA